MKTNNLRALFLFVLAAALSGPCFGQQRVFKWLPANDESVRLDPANYHAGRTYRPTAPGGNIHVDIQAEKPVTIFLADADEWNDALQHPEKIAGLRQLCPSQHVTQTTYVCELPAEAMTLIIFDERNNPDRAVFAGLGAVLNPENKTDRAAGAGIATMLTGQGSVTHRFMSPNDVHVQYYRWDCVENCVQPELQWISRVKEKYELTSFLKVYGGFVPDHDADQVSIKVKSPVPMMVAMLPSQVANQLHSNPGGLESALQNSPCQQRGVQKLEFQCTFNSADGPQSLVIGPEPGGSVPNHKKAEIEMLAVQCVANCALLTDKH
ncbi:MAG TPA: hypothetical protein VLY23_06580 [Candidatus Acidoferrum sp.]|nr:hypothetical protein [Candidatus Acidoferrum sp.]